jgi:uncharacterized protein
MGSGSCEALEQARLKRFGGPVGVRVRQTRDQLRRKLRDHGILGAQVFGSVARGDDAPTSDLDLLVDLPEGMGLFELAALTRDLAEILGGPVDIVPEAGLTERVRADIAADLVKL